MLGPADVSDVVLWSMVADLIGRSSPAADVLEVSAVEVEVVDYDLSTITTGGRFWVSGTAATTAGDRQFRLFVKVVQNWSRSPLFAEIPPEIAAFAAGSVPWRSEPGVYRSDLADRLPDGLSMAPCLGVFDLDDQSSSIWLAEVPRHDWPWDQARYERAGYLLGRMSASERVAPVALVDDHDWTLATYYFGRVLNDVVPRILDDDLWQHPLLAESFAGVRPRLRAAVEELPVWVEELMAAPHVAGHGDACPNNLLGTGNPDAFILIDFGFWRPLPLGFDLGQLLVGDVQLGRRGADDLACIDAAITSAYVDGLRAEGYDVDDAYVARLHALQTALFSGISVLPVEHLDRPVTSDLLDLARTRAALATYCLDRVEATAATPAA